MFISIILLSKTEFFIGATILLLTILSLILFKILKKCEYTDLFLKQFGNIKLKSNFNYYVRVYKLIIFKFKIYKIKIDYSEINNIPIQKMSTILYLNNKQFEQYNNTNWLYLLYDNTILNVDEIDLNLNDPYIIAFAKDIKNKIRLSKLNKI
jgi:hypothetical protein